MKNYRDERALNEAFQYSNLGIGTYKNGKDGLWPRYESERFTFYTEDGTPESGHKFGAWSYNWWQFVAKSADGKTIYFNDSSYSMQTSGHQGMARRILALMDAKSNGFKVKTVYVRSGLQDIQRAIDDAAFDLAKDEHALKERSIRDRKAYERSVKFHKNKILELLTLGTELGQRVKAPTAKRHAELYAKAKRVHESDREFKRRRAAQKRDRDLKDRANATIARFATAGIDLIADSQELIQKINESNVIQLKKGDLI
jgi:hypothetical protein